MEPRRNYFRALFAAAALCATTALGQTAPSFDCSKARSEDEKAICASAELSRLDEQNAAFFKIALAKSRVEALRVRDDFLVDRRKCGRSSSCIEALYRKSIETYRSIKFDEGKEGDCEGNLKQCEVRCGYKFRSEEKAASCREACSTQKNECENNVAVTPNPFLDLPDEVFTLGCKYTGMQFDSVSKFLDGREEEIHDTSEAIFYVDFSDETVNNIPADINEDRIHWTIGKPFVQDDGTDTFAQWNYIIGRPYEEHPDWPIETTHYMKDGTYKFTGSCRLVRCSPFGCPNKQ